MCVCVCEESTAQEQSLYDKLSIAADFLLHFRDFQLTELSEVISFTSYRPFRSFFEVAAIFLHDELPHAPYAHAQAGFYMKRTISHMEFVELKDCRWVPFCAYILYPDRSGGRELLSMPALKKICPQM